jgi:hypothetical protein
MRKLITGAATAATLGATLLLAPSGASADGTVTITPSSEQLVTTETRATGHVDFDAHSLHVWTEGATSTDKAAGYFPVETPLADVGEPSMVWRFNDTTLPAVPGQQIVFDADDITGNGNDYNILVGEPVYGDVWWLTGGSSDDAKKVDPSGADNGGNGSEWFGTLDQWRAALPDAVVYQGGFSLGSGVHGDGNLVSMTYGDTTYRFGQDVTVTPVFRHSATKSCGLVSTYVGVDSIPAGAIADPASYGFKVTITNRKTGDTVTPDHGSLRPGQSSSFARSFGEDSGPRDVRIFKNGTEVQIVHVATNCRS